MHSPPLSPPKLLENVRDALIRFAFSGHFLRDAINMYSELSLLSRAAHVSLLPVYV